MKTAAVVVTYNPDREIVSRVKAIARECKSVFIIDNGSDAASLKPLKKSKAQLVQLGKNTGIAHAQNVGLNLAFKKGADAVIFFDHDSTPQRGFTQSLWRAYQTQPAPVIVGAQVFDVNTRQYSRYPVAAGPFFRRRHCAENAILTGALLAIASGTLITRAVFEKTGGMREEFFIDYVDWEYCLRARRLGIATIICGGAVLEHARGERTGKKILGLTVRPPGYSLFRYRHIYRNRARLFKEYFFRSWPFVCFECVALCRDSLLLFFEPGPFSKLVAAVRNWFGGLFAIQHKT